MAADVEREDETSGSKTAPAHALGAAAPPAPEATVSAAPGLSSDRRGYLLRRLLLGADVLALLGASTAVLAYGRFPTAGEGGPALHDVPLAVLGVFAWILLVRAHGLYHVGSRRVEHGVTEELGPILQLVTLASFLAFIALSVAGLASLTAGQCLVFWATALVLEAGLRCGVRSWARHREWYRVRTLIIGERVPTDAMLRKVRRHPEWGLDVIGCVDLSGAPGTRREVGSVTVVGCDADVLGLVRHMGADRVLLAWSARFAEERLELVRELCEARVHVDLIPTWFELLGLRFEVHEMEGTPLLSVPLVQLSRSDAVFKRALDIGLASLALGVLSPLLALCALAIKLDSPGPILFRQRRIGRSDRCFRVFKFRSMFVDAECRKPEVARLNFHGGGEQTGMFKVRRDPRVTRVGRWLRSTSLDELPQLFNVLRGEMSLVGPRPLIENEDRQVGGHFRRRMTLSPGLTGLWQIHGRSDIAFDEMVGLDYLYVTSWSLWGDMKILLKTFSAVVRARGAY